MADGAPDACALVGQAARGHDADGFGIFNLVEGIVDHHVLGIHHFNEIVPRDQWIWWDLGFLIWGAVMLAGGWLLLRRGRRQTSDEAAIAHPGQARR